MDQRNRLAAMFPIHHKIGVECEHRVPVIDLGHSHNTCIRQRHRLIAVFPMQTAQGRDMLVHVKRDSQGTIFQQRKNSILGVCERGEQVHCLCQNWLTNEQGGV